MKEKAVEEVGYGEDEEGKVKQDKNLGSRVACSVVAPFFCDRFHKVSTGLNVATSPRRSQNNALESIRNPVRE